MRYTSLDLLIAMEEARDRRAAVVDRLIEAEGSPDRCEEVELLDRIKTSLGKLEELLYKAQYELESIETWEEDLNK